MVAVIYPVGRYMGQTFSSPEATDPDFHEVRAGGETYQLTSAEHAVWVLAHGDADEDGGGGASRTFIDAEVRKLGLDTADEPFAALLEMGLLVQFVPVGANLRAFAEAYRIGTMGMGLGNTAEQLDSVLVGLPEQPWISLSPMAFALWQTADDSRSLWECCTDLAAESAGQASADELLEEFVQSLPVMLAVSCVYIDRRRS